ncbi:MAG: ThuA domain-containing protein [Opitutaceae bacterium]
MKTFLLVLLACLGVATAHAAEKKIIFLAGPPSHPSGQHEARAGLMLFQKLLADVPGLKIEVHNFDRAWVEDEKVFDDATAVVLYSDGAGGHPFLRPGRLAKIGALMAKGVSLGLIHYAVEPTKEQGQPEFIAWTGGAFEGYYSVNPIFDGEFKSLPTHPITRGVKPFSARDEWYYHIRFRENMAGVTPILTLVPPLTSLNRPNPPKPDDAPRLREGNPSVYAAVLKQEPEPVMWVTERPDGGRGFGFSGGHFHANWGGADQRKLMLNAILWLARLEVPANGVESIVTPEDLQANLDVKAARGRGAPPPPAKATSAPGLEKK